MTETALEAKPGAEGDTTDLTDNKDHIVDSIDNCKLRIDRTDKELDFSNDISDFTGHTVDLTERTKLTDVRKRHMSNHEGLQYTTFPQIESSALLVTQLTSGSQETPPSQTTMSATMFCIPMPPPGALGSPMFEGANVTEFLERYEDLCLDYQVSENDRLMRLP
jgi:hypothetical protein